MSPLIKRAMLPRDMLTPKVKDSIFPLNHLDVINDWDTERLSAPRLIMLISKLIPKYNSPCDHEPEGCEVPTKHKYSLACKSQETE